MGKNISIYLTARDIEQLNREADMAEQADPLHRRPTLGALVVLAARRWLSEHREAALVRRHESIGALSDEHRNYNEQVG